MLPGFGTEQFAVGPRYIVLQAPTRLELERVAERE